MNGLTVVVMKANGKRIICTAKVSTHGETVVATRENTLTTVNKVSVSTLGKITANMRATGTTENSTVKVSIDKPKAKREKVDGKKVSVSPGWMNSD